MTYSLQQKLSAEAIGSTLLLATVVGSGIMAQTLAQGNAAIALLANAIATGAMLFVLITMLGPVSGAHLNPAVTLIFALRKEISAPVAFAFVLTQLAGTICGAILAHAMFGQELIQISGHARNGSAQWLSEAVATFGLVMTILGTLRTRPDVVSVSVALFIIAAYWFTASTSFANPAVTIARSLSNTFAGIAPADVPGFLIAQLVGAILALIVAEKLFGWTREEREEPSLSGSLES